MNRAWRMGLVIGLAVAGGPAMADVATQAAQRVFAQVAPSVVTVHAYDGKGTETGQASGVVVAEGRVATNCHAVREAASLRVAAVERTVDAKWIRQDQGRDLCILAADGLAAPVVRPRGSASLTVGEPVFAVGNPLGFGLAVSAGLVAAVDLKETGRTIVATASMSPGSSGGGLFDGEGRLVGITTAILGAGQNLNLILSADGLDRLVASGAPPRLPAPPPPAERRWSDEAKALQQAAEWGKLEELASAWRIAQPAAAQAPTYLGVAQSAQNRNQEAIVSFRQALDLDAHLSFAWLMYGRALRAEGRQQEAEQALARAEAVYPNYADVAILRAEWRLQDGLLDEARRQADIAIRMSPGKSNAWRILGWIEQARGNDAEATRAYQVALRLGDVDRETRDRLARLLASSGKADDASRVAAAGDSSSAENAATYVAIGLAEWQRGRLAPAEDALRKATTLAPKNVDAWRGLGQVLQRSGRPVEAEEALNRALELVPDHVDTVTNRAYVRRAAGRQDDALKDARLALSLAPAGVEAWRAYGVLQFDKRNCREAAVAFGKVDQLGKAAVDDLVSLGDCQANTGDVEGGLKTLARAEAMNPAHVRLNLSLARALGNKGDVARALDHLERVLKIDSTNKDAWSSKGYALIKLGRLAEAVQALETTVSLAPDFANGWINLGEAQLRNRNLGRAIQALEKAVTLAPQAVDARLFLGEAYLGARMPNKARQQSESLLRSYPNMPQALALLTFAHLAEGNTPAAAAEYKRLKMSAPAVARSVRDRALAAGVPGAKSLPE